MRTIMWMTACALALTACGKAGETRSAGAGPPTAATPTAVTTLPARKAGLWEQTMTRDGKAGMMGKVRMCLDAATDAKMSLFGHSVGRSLCKEQSVSRGLDGSYRFASTCEMGDAGATVSKGALTGDFASHYRVHSESDTSGAKIATVNGHHVTDVEATYVGPCPADLAPGDIEMAPGIKININKITQAAAAVGGGKP